MRKQYNTARRVAFMVAIGGPLLVLAMQNGFSKDQSPDCRRAWKFLARREVRSKKKPSKQELFEAYRLCATDREIGERLYARELEAQRKLLADERLKRNLSELADRSRDAEGLAYDLRKKEIEGEEILRREREAQAHKSITNSRTTPIPKQ